MAVPIVKGQEVIGANLPLKVIMMGAMVMMLVIRGGLAAVSHFRDEDNDGQNPSKGRYILVVQ